MGPDEAVDARAAHSPAVDRIGVVNRWLHAIVQDHGHDGRGQHADAEQGGRVLAREHLHVDGWDDRPRSAVCEPKGCAPVSIRGGVRVGVRVGLSAGCEGLGLGL